MFFGDKPVLLADERAAAQMQHERVVAEHVPVAGAVRAQAEVVLLAVAAPERRVEHADGIDQLALDVEAEADARRQQRIRGHRRGRERGPHRLGVGPVRPDVVGAETRVRADLGVVRPWRDGADVRARRGAAGQRVEPSRGHLGVRIEQHDVVARQPQAAVGGAGEAEIRPVREQRELRQAARAKAREHVADPGVRRSVVDQDQPVAAARVREHARHAALDVVRRVVHRDHDVDRRRGRLAGAGH